MNDGAQIRRLIEQGKIEDLIAANSAGLDRADTAALASTYDADALVEFEGFSGVAAEFIRNAISAQFGRPVSQHRVCQSAIRIFGHDARAESYVTITREIPEAFNAGSQQFVFGRYLDCFTYGELGWKISRRTFVLDTRRTRGSTCSWPEADFFMPRGGQRTSDAGRVLMSEWALGMQDEQQLNRGQASMDRAGDGDLECLLAREAIKQLTVRFGRGIDRGDGDLIAATLHPDATIMMGPVRGVGREAAKALAASVRSNLKRSHHAISNQWFDIRGDRAIGETYAFAVVAMDVEGQELEAVNGGRYLDRFEKRDGAWKIAHRTLVMDFVSTNPTTAADREALARATARGCFGSEDPSYVLWRDWMT
jgi:ketosteroid isomerase-like protein